MLTYIMRHGIAAEPDATRFPDDDLRPLTAHGKQRTKAVARGMAAMELGINRIITSPLVRADQTARIVAGALRMSGDLLSVSEALRPDRAPPEILPELTAHAGDSGILLVGHEPHLSQLVSWLLTGSEEGMQMNFKKAGLACVECTVLPRRVTGVLQFFLKPSQFAKGAD